MIARRFRFVFSAFFFLFLTVSVSAAVTLPYFFSDGMVLQQQTDAAVWGWAKAGSTVTITSSWNKKKYSVKAGTDGKWKAKINTPAAGGPYELTITETNTITIKNILIGEVWLCSGQSNMEMPMKGFRDQPILNANDAVFGSTNDNLRLYIVPRSVQRLPQDTTKNSSWKAAAPEAVSNFSAAAYYFGKMLQEKLKVPVGLVNISYGGSPVEAFMDPESLKAFPEMKVHAPTDTIKLSNKNATTLYNGMLRPFLGYTIRGCIWYQGESNNDRPKQYESMFPAFVKQIREQSGQDFPFYFCQIAPYNYTNGAAAGAVTYNSAFLRDAQRKAVNRIPNSGMAVLLDQGEEWNIHPANKEVVGKRLAYLAFGQTYGFKGLAFQSPTFDSLLINGNTATIKFKNAPNGLTSFGKTLNQFEIAGADKVFRPAIAIIRNGMVQVNSPAIANPVAVRYAFKDFIIGELFSTEGFPVSSFRTDDW